MNFMDSARGSFWSQITSEPCRRAIALAVLLSLLFFRGGCVWGSELSGDNALSVPPFANYPSLSQDPVDVKTGGIRLRIPRNYLNSATLYHYDGALDNYDDVPGRTIAVGLTVGTTFPEFTGATEQTIHCFERQGDCPSKLVLLYTLGKSQQDVNQRRAPAVAAAAHVAGADQAELVQVNVKVSLVPDDIFVAYGGTVDNSNVVECSRDEIASRTTYCRVYIKFEGVPMLYQFHRTLLPHWRAIHSGIMQMLASFYIRNVQ
jgi:hypothetical protein